MTPGTHARLALVGCGRLAELGYLPAVTAAPHAGIVAVVDPDASRRRSVASLAPGPVVAVPTVEDLVSEHSDEVDGVIVASPSQTHLAAASAAVAAGLPVLVEKPPAPDGAGARAIAALSPAPWIGFNRRFDPGAMRARVAARRALRCTAGPLDVTIDLLYRHKSWSPYAVNDDVLGDLGPHVLDWVRWVTGAEMTTVAATADHHRAELHVELDSGGTAAIRLASDRPHRERLVVADATGTVVADHRLGGPVSAVTGRLRPGPHPLVTTLSAQVTAFVHAIGGQVSPLLGTAADGVAAMAAVDAARRSATGGGGPVALDHLVPSPA